jgi:hypothetical protein
MSIATAAATFAATAAFTAYVDAKFHVSQDFGQIARKRRADSWYLENGGAPPVDFCKYISLLTLV